MQLQRIAQDLGRDERIAVPVAADPASHPKKRWQRVVRRLPGSRQQILERTVQPRNLAQEGMIVERQPVGDFVENGQLVAPEQIGLPQGEHGAAELLFVRREFIRRKLHALAPVDQTGDFHFAINRALAANFRRMRGQDRADQSLAEEAAQIVVGNSGSPRASGRGRQCFMGQRAAFDIPVPGAADVVLVFGDVGEMGENS